MLISVCLCTYRRPTVARTLASLAAQLLPADCSLEIVVVDNDPSGSAEALVRACSPDAIYAIEPGPNIAAARNRTLELARGEWLAFLDDDEEADATWLAQLLRAADAHNADAIIGRVVAIYPEAAPAALRAADPLSRDWGPTGKRLDAGSTANALLRARLVRGSGPHFDPQFGRSGGEDSDFFGRLAEGGARIVASREAVVRESAPASRLDPAYLRRRALRAGQSYGLARLRSRPSLLRVPFLAASSAKAAGFLLVARLLGRTKRPIAWRLQLRGWLNVGKLRACLGRPMPIMY